MHRLPVGGDGSKALSDLVDAVPAAAVTGSEADGVRRQIGRQPRMAAHPALDVDAVVVVSS